MKSTWIVSIYLYTNAVIRPNLCFLLILSMKKCLLCYLYVEEGTMKGKTDHCSPKSPRSLGCECFVNTDSVLLRKVF